MIYLKPDLHKALRLKAVETSRSVSELISEAISASVEKGAEDFAALEERTGEPYTASLWSTSC